MLGFLLRAQPDSIPIGKVMYSHQVHLEGDNDCNGLAALYFNLSASLYVHMGVPEEGYNQQTDDYTFVNIAGDPEGFPVYKLHRERKMWSKIPCYQSKTHCIVEDTLGAIDWVISPAEKKRIATFECVKAVGTFGGRVYEAWFTYDIPIPSGPYKLGGLPGLILEAQTLDGKVQFLFDGIDLSGSPSRLIQPPSGKFLHMSHYEYIKSSDKHDEEVVKAFKAKGYEVTIQRILDTIELVEDE